MDLQERHMISSDEIYEDLCKKIENLVYMPGQRISEYELCQQYKTTRHMVRSALQQLRQRKLVEVYPQRGTFVSLIDIQYISDVLYLREALEQESIRRIIDFGEVEGVCRNMREYIVFQKQCKEPSKCSEKFYEMDIAFHKCLYDAVGRKEIVSFISEPYIHFRRWRNFELRYLDRVKHLVQEHEELVEAIEQKDAEKARKILHEHLDTVTKYSKSIKESERKYMINF